MVKNEVPEDQEMSSYQAATLFLCDLFETSVVDGKLRFPQYTFADSIAHQLPGIEWVADTGGIAHYVVDESIASIFIQLARNDYWFYDCCVEICVSNIDAEAEIPGALQHFAIEVLKGKWARPKKRGVEREKNWLRDFFLHNATTLAVQKFGLPLTRNDVSQNVSACDAVAEALTVCGRKLTYTKVKNLMVHPDKETFRKEKALVDRLREESKSQNKDRNFLDPEFYHLLSALVHSTHLEIVSISAERGKKDSKK